MLFQIWKVKFKVNAHMKFLMASQTNKRIWLPSEFSRRFVAFGKDWLVHKEFQNSIHSSRTALQMLVHLY